MKWFENMKIRSKLMTLLIILVLIAMGISGIAIVDMNNLNNRVELLQEYPMQRYDNLNYMTARIYDLRRIVSVMPFYFGDASTLNGLQREAADNVNEIYRMIGVNEESVRSDPLLTDQSVQTRVLDDMATLRRLVEQYKTQVVDEMFSSAMEGILYDQSSRNRAEIHLERGRVVYAELDEVFNGLKDAAKNTMDTRSDEINALTTRTRNVLIAVTVFGLFFGIVISLYIANTIIRPVSEVVDILDNVSNGNFNINMKSELTRDEVGVMTHYSYNLINKVRAMIDDISTLTNEITVNGDIDYRIDADAYSGGYNDMMVALNDFTDSYVGEVNAILKILSNVNNGNFKAELKKFPGKKVVLNNTMDELMASLQAVSGEVNSMIEAAAVKGNLRFVIDSKKYDGGWREIMDGLNDIAKAVNAPITEIETIMGNLSRGDFSSKVSGNYAGDFLKIKNAVNTTIDTLSGYITEITDSLSLVASGDLRKTINRDYVGSFSAIKDSLNNISRTLNQTMSEIASASDQVLSGAKQISASAMDLANGASTQASSVEELNASIDLINQQTQANAKNAGEANNLSMTSTENAREGNDAMQQTLSAMNQIKDASNSISKIIRTIQDIAFQTNLLALNAAVEAARAGEHGRGFAVVAEEVRSLAARSQTAASETTSLISHSIDTVETGSGIAKSTAETLDTIVENANKVLDVVTLISNASIEQAEAISQISIGLNQISQVVQSNSAVSEETAAASEELNSQAELLQQLVAYFKV